MNRFKIKSLPKGIQGQPQRFPAGMHMNIDYPGLSRPADAPTASVQQEMVALKVSGR